MESAKHGESASALTAAPQMESIQRSLFKAKQELEEHIEHLKSEIAKPDHPEDSEERRLLAILLEIKNLTEESNMLELHRRTSNALKLLTEKTKEAKNEIKDESNYRSIGSTVRRLSGMLRFSAAVSSKEEAVEETPPTTSSRFRLRKG